VHDVGRGRRRERDVALLASPIVPRLVAIAGTAVVGAGSISTGRALTSECDTGAVAEVTVDLVTKWPVRR